MIGITADQDVDGSSYSHAKGRRKLLQEEDEFATSEIDSTLYKAGSSSGTDCSGMAELVEQALAHVSAAIGVELNTSSVDSLKCAQSVVNGDKVNVDFDAPTGQSFMVTGKGSSSRCDVFTLEGEPDPDACTGGKKNTELLFAFQEFVTAVRPPTENDYTEVTTTTTTTTTTTEVDDDDDTTLLTTTVNEDDDEANAVVIVACVMGAILLLVIFALVYVIKLLVDKNKAPAIGKEGAVDHAI